MSKSTNERWGLLPQMWPVMCMYCMEEQHGHMYCMRAQHVIDLSPAENGGALLGSHPGLGHNRVIVHYVV